MGIAGATIAAAGIGAAASLGSGMMQSNTASKAQGQAQAQFQQQRNDLGPYREAGLPALEAQQALLGLQGQPAADAAMANFQSSPGYQFQFDEGQRAVESSMAAQGLLRSGATLKGLEKFGQGLANSDFSNYYARLMDMSKLGETAAAGGAANAGNAATAALGGANAQNSITGNIAGGLGTTTNALLNNTAVRDWLGGGGGVSSSDVSNNALYQQGAFAAAGPGAWGPWK